MVLRPSHASATSLGPADASGRRRPQPIPGSEFELACDTVIVAVGQRPEAPWAEQLPDLKWTARNLMQVDPHTMQTSRPHIFAAGDAVSGPATVIEAVAGAHRAAEAIHCFVQHGALPDQHPGRHPPPPRQCPTGSRSLCGPATPARGPNPFSWLAGARVANFSEIESGFSDTAARQEAGRCLNCGLCCECMQCVQACEAKAIDHNMVAEEVKIPVGSIILATGYDILDPTVMAPYGYGKYPNVYTSLEFERLSNATGPTGGRILIRDENGEFTRTPHSVAILHCIGSRDVNYHAYCSRVCCMYALKFTHLLKEKVGHSTQVFDFYIDQRTFGKGYEEFYQRCQEEGTVFIRGKVAEITDQPVSPAETGKLIAVAEDTLLGERVRVPVDMVILCTAIQARADAAEVGRIFGVNTGADGFFLEEHPKLAPLNTATDGVFLAGTCQAPRDIPDTVAQASGAAAKSLALATRGHVQVPSAISWIDPDLCAGCQVCIGLCPYTAIEYDQRRGISVVNEAVCKGCGSCAGFCPSGAARIRHFKPKQIFAEIDGILDTLHQVGM